MSVPLAIPTNPAIYGAVAAASRHASGPPPTLGETAIIVATILAVMWLVSTVGFWLMEVADGSRVTLRGVLVAQAHFLGYALRRLW